MHLHTTEQREQALRNELERIVEIIINEYQPEKIIVFGSLAEERVHEWSDIDLLIIKSTEKRPIERYLELTRLIRPEIGVDLFIYTPEEYDLLLKEGFSLLKGILRTAKTLYEKRG